MIDASERRRNRAEQVLGLSGRDPAAGVAHAYAKLVDPQAPVGIEHHLDHARIGQRIEHGSAELAAQLLLQAHVELIVQR